MDTTTTKTAVDEFLVRCNVRFSVSLAQRDHVNDDGWKSDAWNVRLQSGKLDMNTMFYTGTGHRAKPEGYVASRIKREYGKLAERSREWIAACKPVAPSAASVLFSLLSEGEAVDQSFVDWCAEFGYDEDSRKALRTYEACCESGVRLRKLFTPTQRAELADLLKDY